MGGSFTADYINGFIPEFRFQIDEHEIHITVYGNYASWDPIPERLNRLLAWGKPDLVLIQRDTGEILLAVEETAATPTGNQALQRCERQFGAANEGFPFWYLISEFGKHKDGGTRKDSVWPTLMGLELMHGTQVPSIILHYSDADNPEDYSTGTGTTSLFKLLALVLRNCSNGLEPFANANGLIESQLQEMVSYVESNWSAGLYFVADVSHLNIAEEASRLCSTSRNPLQDNAGVRSSFLRWPLVSDLSSEQQRTQAPRPLLKRDVFAETLEADIGERKAYGPIKGSGSKPQRRKSLDLWIRQQNAKQSDWQTRSGHPDSEFKLQLRDFPQSKSGLHHVITSQRILYLYDSTEDAEKAIWKSFRRLRNKRLFSDTERHSPALVYVSNSVKPGRIFGDPYTGQISAYSVSFGALSKARVVIAYFPHQSVAQAADELADQNNKGQRIMAELTDLLIFGGGLAIRAKHGELI
jgi:hypothetical protein